MQGLDGQIPHVPPRTCNRQADLLPVDLSLFSPWPVARRGNPVMADIERNARGRVYGVAAWRGEFGVEDVER